LTGRTWRFFDERRLQFGRAVGNAQQHRVIHHRTFLQKLQRKTKGETNTTHRERKVRKRQKAHRSETLPQRQRRVAERKLLLLLCPCSLEFSVRENQDPSRNKKRKTGKKMRESATPRQRGTEAKNRQEKTTRP
jgi:hypothetical protein